MLGWRELCRAALLMGLLMGASELPASSGERRSGAQCFQLVTGWSGRRGIWGDPKGGEGQRCPSVGILQYHTWGFILCGLVPSPAMCPGVELPKSCTDGDTAATVGWSSMSAQGGRGGSAPWGHGSCSSRKPCRAPGIAAHLGQGQGGFCCVTLLHPRQPLALEEPLVPVSVC